MSGLLFADLLCQLHDLKSVFLLAVCQQLLVDRIVDAHTNHAKYSDDNTKHKRARGPIANLSHGKAHPGAEHKGGNDAEGIAEDIGGQFGLCVQLAERDDL